MRDGARHLQGFGAVLRLLNLQVNDVLHAFAVGDDLLGERAADFKQGDFKLFANVLQTDSAGAGSEEQNGIVGGSVAVHRDDIESCVAGVLQCAAQFAGCGDHVGEHVYQHGGELGMDHARAFGDSGDGAASGAQGNAGKLGARVGGENGIGELAEMIDGGAGFSDERL